MSRSESAPRKQDTRPTPWEGSTFSEYSVEGTKLNEKRISEFVNDSLMLVTALSPEIGYDKASRIAHMALDEGTILKQAALKTGWIDSKTFDQIVDPVKMVFLHN